MFGLGAEQVLIDGAIDRRAASSPAVADGLVMATGAVLNEDIDRSWHSPRRRRARQAAHRRAFRRRAGGGRYVAESARAERRARADRRMAHRAPGRTDFARRRRSKRGVPAGVCWTLGASAPDDGCGSSRAIPRGCSYPAGARAGTGVRASRSRSCTRSSYWRSRSTPWRRNHTAWTPSACASCWKKRSRACPCWTCSTRATWRWRSSRR